MKLFKTENFKKSQNVDKTEKNYLKLEKFGQAHDNICRWVNGSFYFTFYSKVQEGDQIVLESVKFPGQYLHSSYPYKMDNFINYGSEINIGVERSGCTLVHFFRPSQQTNCMLRVCRSFYIFTISLA